MHSAPLLIFLLALATSSPAPSTCNSSLQEIDQALNRLELAITGRKEAEERHQLAKAFYRLAREVEESNGSSHQYPDSFSAYAGELKDKLGVEFTDAKVALRKTAQDLPCILPQQITTQEP